MGNFINFNKEDWKLAAELTRQRMKQEGISKKMYIFIVSAMILTFVSGIVISELNPQVGNTENGKLACNIHSVFLPVPKDVALR